MEVIPGGVMGVLRQPVEKPSRWHHMFARGDMPTNAPTHINAWPFDTEWGKAFKLTGSYVVAPLR
jgi:hypothetical protein